MHMTGTLVLQLQIGHPIQVCGTDGRWGEIDHKPELQYFLEQC